MARIVLGALTRGSGARVVGRGRVADADDVDPGEDVAEARLEPRSMQRVAPHDHGVLAVVRVVAAAPSDGAETEALVQADRAIVAGAHLERDPPRPQLVAALDECGE